MKEFEIRVFQTKRDFKGMITVEQAQGADISDCNWILAEFSKNGERVKDIIKINRHRRKDCNSYNIMFTLRGHAIEKLCINKNSLVKMRILSKDEYVHVEETYSKSDLNSIDLIPKTVEMSCNKSIPLVFSHENKLFTRIKGSNLWDINKRMPMNNLSAVAIGGIFGESSQNLATYFAFANSSPFFHRVVLDFLTENMGIRMKDIYGKITYHGPVFDEDVKKRLSDFYTHTTGIDKVVMDTYKVAKNINKMKWPNGCLSMCINGLLANQFMINLIKRAPLHDDEFLKGFMIGFSNAECSVNVTKGNIAHYKLNFKEGQENKAGRTYQQYFKRLNIKSSVVSGCNQIIGPLRLSKFSCMTVGCGKKEIGPLSLTPHKEVMMMRGLRNHCQIRMLELLEEFSGSFYEAVDISKIINQRFGLNFSKHDISNNLRVIDPEYANVEIKNVNRGIPNKYRVSSSSKHHEIHEIIKKLEKRLLLAEKNLAGFNKTLKKFRLGSMIIDEDLRKIITHPTQ